MLEMSKDWRSLRASEVKRGFLAAALLSYVLQASLLISFGSAKPFFQSSSSRGTDAAALPACEHALQSLPRGKPSSITHKCSRFAGMEWNLRNIY